jgi:hypothetical protein
MKMSSSPTRRLAAAEGCWSSSWVAMPRATRRPRCQSVSLNAPGELTVDRLGEHRVEVAGHVPSLVQDAALHDGPLPQDSLDAGGERLAAVDHAQDAVFVTSGTRREAAPALVEHRHTHHVAADPELDPSAVMPESLPVRAAARRAPPVESDHPGGRKHARPPAQPALQPNPLRHLLTSPSQPPMKTEPLEGESHAGRSALPIRGLLYDAVLHLTLPGLLREPSLFAASRTRLSTVPSDDRLELVEHGHDLIDARGRQQEDQPAHAIVRRSGRVMTCRRTGALPRR